MRIEHCILLHPIVDESRTIVGIEIIRRGHRRFLLFRSWPEEIAHQAHLGAFALTTVLDQCILDAGVISRLWGRGLFWFLTSAAETEKPEGCGDQQSHPQQAANHDTRDGSSAQSFL